VTTDAERAILSGIANEWLLARKIIEDFLAELRPDLTAGQLEHNAAAIIARLAHHKPPILVQFARDD
jgi:hypothetical protein